MKGYVDMIRLLVEHGADLTLLDSVHGGTPLGWANHFCQDAAMTLLKQFGAKEREVKEGGISNF
jgi:ankyrin repeat protein